MKTHSNNILFLFTLFYKGKTTFRFQETYYIIRALFSIDNLANPFNHCTPQNGTSLRSC